MGENKITSILNLKILMLALATFGIFLLNVFWPDLNVPETPHQYQSYRQAIISADNYKQTGNVLLIPQPGSVKSENARPAPLVTFQSYTYDDIGFALFLTFLVSTDIIQFDEDKLKELKIVSKEDSRILMNSYFISKTHIAVKLWTSFCLFIFLLSLIYYAGSGRELIANITFFVSILCSIIFLFPFIDTMVHGHSFVTGAWVITLSLPFLMGKAIHIKNNYLLIAFILLVGILLEMIFLIRSSTGYLVCLAWVSYVLFFLSGGIRSKLLALSPLLIVFGLTTAIFYSLDQHQNLILSSDISPQESTLNQQRESTNSHPIYHSLMYGIAPSKDDIKIKSEQGVREYVAEKYSGGVMDGPVYINATKQAYIDSLKEDPIGIAFQYFLNIRISLDQALTNLNIPLWFLVTCIAILLFLALENKIREALQYRSSAIFARITLLSLPASLLTSLVWRRPSLDMLTLIIFSIFIACLAIMEILKVLPNLFMRTEPGWVHRLLGRFPFSQNLLDTTR